MRLRAKTSLEPHPAHRFQHPLKQRFVILARDRLRSTWWTSIPQDQRLTARAVILVSGIGEDLVRACWVATLLAEQPAIMCDYPRIQRGHKKMPGKNDTQTARTPWQEQS
jgi:hypothetical protein